MEGVQQGFHIVDSMDFQQVEVDNYWSATNPDNRSTVEKQILTELEEGRYVRVSAKPTIVSGLGAIPKPSGGIRLIHDGSRPTGSALNDYALLDQHLRFQSLEDAVDFLSSGSYLAKIDLKSAYRSVKTHPSNWDACGLKWTFEGDAAPTYMIDTALPFGSRLAPGTFHRLSQAVRRMMVRAGFPGVVVYLDDFLIIEPSFDRCLQAQNTLIATLRSLGFSIAWNKVEGPSKSLVFLGVNIDTCRGYLELPPDKLLEFHHLIKDTLELRRLSLRQLQTLAGKLNWAAGVVRGGRTYLRRVLDVMRPLRASHHKALITEAMKEDLKWWDAFLRVFNGRRWVHPTSQWINVYVDASLKGGGMAWGSDWAYVNWHSETPKAADAHINVKEVMAIAMAVRRWAPSWVNASVVMHTDNITARAAINKGTTKSSIAMKYVREIFWWATLFNIKLRAVHIPGRLNIVADAISRLHSRVAYNGLQRFLKLHVLPPLHILLPYLLQHMSLSTLLSVLPQINRWHKDLTTSTRKCLDSSCYL